MSQILNFYRINKFNFLFLGLLAFAMALPSSSAHAQDFVEQEDFQELKQEFQESLKQIEQKVDMGNEALNASKEYVESADKMTDRFFLYLGIFIAVISLLFGGGLVAIYRWSTSKYKKALEQEYEEYKKQVSRLFSTEKDTMYIKENARILFIQKKGGNGKDSTFENVKKTIFSKFKEENLKNIEVNGFSEILENRGITNFVREKNPLKMVLMNDDLFKGGDAETGLKLFFETISKNDTGFVLFGETRLGAYKFPFKAYTNQPYSVYPNVNNLLKYMMAAKNIKP